jgi:aspartate/methionine/tyrosine aminotransferase
MPASARVRSVQAPIMPLVGRWMAESPGTISLGQGVVAYGPPPAALARIPELLARPGAHRYVPDAGLPELRAAFAEKLRRENGVELAYERRLMVTAGANQGFLQALLCICDPGDEVILLRPYYFNNEMAVRLAGCRPVLVDTDADYQPVAEAIAAAVGPRTRAVVTISPNNPTGAVYPRARLAAVNALCAERGIYHIHDEAYEYFLYDGAQHFSPAALGGDEHTITLYTLSKAFGFASWRVGFVIVPAHLFDELLKVQDTNAICAPGLSQAVAVELLRIGRAWCAEHLRGIAAVRAEALRLLAGAGDLLTLPPAPGAFYLLPRVRTRASSLALCERLIREHRVAVIPGATFGVEDTCCLRVSYGGITLEEAREGFGRLVEGLRAIAG